MVYKDNTQVAHCDSFYITGNYVLLSNQFLEGLLLEPDWLKVM